MDFYGATGIAYEDGIIVILLYVGNAVTFLFGYWLFAARWRSPEFLHRWNIFRIDLII